MKLIIDIPNYVYCDIQAFKTIYDDKIEIVSKAIIDGTPLPKGHGDLIDRNSLITITDIRIDGTEFTYVPYSEIETAQAIVKADISGKE